VWNKVKAVLNNSDKLTECINRALAELKEKKVHIGAETLDVDGKLETLRKKMERLGMVFSDGAIEESAYKSKLKQRKKQEASLLKCRRNIDPLDMEELEALEGRTTFIKEVMSRGKLEVTEFGLFGNLFDEEIYVPAGFNAWRESDGELAIGEVTEMDYFRIEGTNKYMRGIDVPPVFGNVVTTRNSPGSSRRTCGLYCSYSVSKCSCIRTALRLRGPFRLRFCIRGSNQSRKLVWLSLPLPLIKGDGEDNF